MNRWSKFILFGLVSVLVLLVIFNSSLRRRIFVSHTATVDDAHLPPPASGFLNLAADVRYVGDDECATCHSGIYRTFKKTGMGRSFSLPAPDQVIEDYTTRNRLYDSRANLHYQMIQEAGHFYQLEYRLDEKGQQTHALRRKADFIIGSGNHNRTYLTSENGFLFEMPVTWYSQKKIWDLSPGYHARNWRFSRPITPECMVCHNLGNVQLLTGNEPAALTLFQQAIVIDPRFVPAYGNLAVIYQRRGRKDEAIRCLQKVLEIDPQDNHAQNMLQQLALQR